MTFATGLVVGLMDLMLLANPALYGQPSAVIWKDQLLAVPCGPRSYTGNPIFRGTFTPEWPGVRLPSEYRNPANGWFVFQAKLDVRDNRILVFQAGQNPSVFALADLPLLEMNEFGQHLVELKGFGHAGFFANWSASVQARALLFPMHRKPDVSAPKVSVQGPGMPLRNPVQLAWMDEGEYIHLARFDVQLAGQKTVRLFHAHKGKLFVSIEPDYLSQWRIDPKKWEWEDNLKPPPDRELRTGKLPADFTEHFAAYRSGGKDYLVTNNGKVYVAVAKGKTEVEVSPLWTDPKRPIVGVLQDLANDAVYGWGFVGESCDRERFYVKFEAKPEAKPYKRTVPLWFDRSDAYLESYECARAFRNAMEKR